MADDSPKRPQDIYKVPVQEDNSDIPGRFVRGTLGDIELARKRWEATKSWREAEQIDDILKEEQPHYPIIKKYYSHYILGKCKAGYYVWLERPGKSSVSKIYDAKVTIDQLARHYIFVSEFLWNSIDPNDDSMTLSLFDCEGCGVSFLTGKTFELFKKTSKLIQEHYPERSFKIIVINAPFWFKTVFTLIGPFIDPRTKEKIIVVGSDYKKVLAEYLEPTEVPLQYGGTNDSPIGTGKEELLIWDHVKRVNCEKGVEFTRDASTLEIGWSLDVPPGVVNGKKKE
eukprot:GHVR01091345.1.p1 GENE.GHVR01091345.1~~GHVR01091345.1.p1  ORF type:complete len:284 (+),score=47.40 GHVR01091345.1:30-881(+)